jgi:hypothetical protein
MMDTARTQGRLWSGKDMDTRLLASSQTSLILIPPSQSKRRESVRDPFWTQGSLTEKMGNSSIVMNKREP